MWLRAIYMAGHIMESCKKARHLIRLLRDRLGHNVFYRRMAQVDEEFNTYDEE